MPKTKGKNPKKISLKEKYGIEGFSSFQSVLAHDLGYWDPFSPQLAKTNILKPVQLNHQMGFCI